MTVRTDKVLKLFLEGKHTKNKQLFVCVSMQNMSWILFKLLMNLGIYYAQI